MKYKFYIYMLYTFFVFVFIHTYIIYFFVFFVFIYTNTARLPKTSHFVTIHPPPSKIVATRLRGQRSALPVL